MTPTLHAILTALNRNHRKATAMPKFRKKPVEVEARPLTGENWREVYQWLKDNDAQPEIYTSPLDDSPVGLGIHTLEGVMRADQGDFVIQGVKGEFYPCKPDIFAATYEPGPADA